MNQLIFIESFIIIFSIALGQENPAEIINNPCTGTPNTCATCIEAHPACAWCTENDETFLAKSIKRCGFLSDITAKCNHSDIVYPINEIHYTKDEELSQANTHKEDPVQLKPQRIRLKLRPNKPERFVVQFRQAKDYPMDMYYLMDLSNSMKDDKDKLSQLGNLLSSTMVNLTSSFRLGFGSFVDKKVMPFVSTVPKKLDEPCGGCAAPYGFHNQLPLNTNTSLFSEEVNKAQISGNLDNPEVMYFSYGGFDAVMQAIVCEKEIGWRSKARKIIVFSTDSTFHQAGDGLLGGIIKPNDENCHLKDNMYSESTTQDYPSISQLNRQIRQNHVNIIFAVTTYVIDLYKELAKLLEGASAGELQGDSSNVVNLVKEQYNLITSSVELKDNSPGDHIVVRYYSECLDGVMRERNACPGLKVGTTVSFEVEIAVTSCPKNKDESTRKTLQIYPIGLNENIEVELDLVCECECEKTENEIINSPFCSGGNGTFECGICNCNENRHGRLCECDLKGSDDGNDLKACKGPGDLELECSNQGICRCGVCECNEKWISGVFCECNNLACERHDNKLCGGNGICSCGNCVCNLGWTGVACNCKTGNSSCIGIDGKLCSGHGKCVCDECKCDPKTDKDRHSGKYCEECLTCPNQCDYYKDCVQCSTFQTGKYADLDECSQRCQNIQNYTELVKDIGQSEGKLCLHKDESDGCFFNFKYLHFTKKLNQDRIIYIQETKACPEGPNVLYIVLGVTGGIVLIGAILLIIWKVFTTIHDNKEYAKFEEDTKKAQWNEDDNPLFVPSTTEFRNPTFTTAEVK